MIDAGDHNNIAVGNIAAEPGDDGVVGAGLPLIASGMITSRNGWCETPYLPLLAAALTPLVTAKGCTICFVTGIVPGTHLENCTGQRGNGSPS